MIENMGELVYVIAALDRRGATDTQLENARKIFAGDHSISDPEVEEMIELVRAVAGRWGEDGRISPELRSQLVTFSPEAVAALNEVGPVIQILPVV